MINYTNLLQTTLENTISWGVPTTGALLALFFTPLLERIKVLLNRAEARSTEFEKMASDLSNLIYVMQLIHDYYKEGLTEDYQIDPISEKYNEAIYQVRKNEFVYLRWARKYWKQTQLPQFKRTFQLIREIDGDRNRFNTDDVDQDFLKRYLEKIQILSQAVEALLA